MVHGLVTDVRYALRVLRRAPVFAVAAVLTLALGIGVNSVMFSIAHTFLWETLPVTQPSGLVNVFSYNPNGRFWGDMSYPDFQDMRADHAAFADVVAYFPYPLGLSEGGRAERSWGELVSGNYFTMLGVRPALGRVFDEREASGGVAVAVISDRLWRRRFASDPGVVGRTLGVNGRTFTIAGVAPARFHGLFYVGFTPDLWIPADQFDALVVGPPGQLAQRNGPPFRMMARLAPGVTIAQAQASARTVLTRIAAEDPGHRDIDVRVLRAQDARPEPTIAGGFALAARLLLAAVALVLLIACANVANLLLARASARRKEIAVRLALGAPRRRLVWQLLVESFVLAALGGAAGVGLAVWGTGLLGEWLRLPTDIPFNFAFAVSGPVLLYTGLLTFGAAFVFGLVPAFQAVRPELVGALKNEVVTAHGGSAGRLRAGLVVAQIAACVVVLVTTGLALRTLGNLRRVDPGFDTRHGLLVTVAPDMGRYAPARGLAFYQALLDRVRALPGVRAASLGVFVPMDFSNDGGRIYVPGHESRGTDAGAEGAAWAHVTPGFLDALGSRLMAGRDFTERDDSAAPAVAIINEAMARRYWPGQDPLGRQFRMRAPDSALVTVVGVAADMKYNNLMESPTPFVYRPIAQEYQGYATLVVRTATGTPRSLAPAVTDVIRTLDPAMPWDVRTFAELMTGRALILPRLGAVLAGGFGILALLLASVGLYGVVAYGVSQRTREIGIRLALGADRASVLRMVVRGGLGQTALGLGIGAALAIGATRALRSLLFGVGAADPLTYLAVAALLTGVAALASWLPARRAARVDPTITMRAE